MSRLIIKNLPSYVTPERLKEHFSQKNGPGGTVTDVKVAQKPDGSSRRFGFIGFKSDAEAKRAQEYFDRTFIGTTRVNVQVVEVCIYVSSFALRIVQLTTFIRVEEMLLHLDQTKSQDSS